MSGTTETPKPVSKKRKILKLCVIIIIGLLVLLPTLLYLITTSAGITGIVLPLVSSAINMRITADEVDLSLFKSTLRAKNVSVGSGKTALAKAELLEGAFSLNDLLNSRFVFRDVLLDKAVITISRDADGNWTYDSPGKKKITKTSSVAKSPDPSSKTEKTADKILFNLKNIKITNSSFVLATGGAHMELSDLNIELPEFVNNQAANLTLKAHAKAGGGNINVRGGDWNLKLSAVFNDYMHPLNVKCESDLDHLDGEINGVKLNNSNLSLDIDAEGSHESITIKKLCLRQTDGKWVRTNVESSSKITFEPFNIKGNIKVAPISAEIVSIVSQFTREINPGKVGINWSSDFEISDDSFSAAGKLKVSRRDTAVIKGEKYDLPDLDLKADYDFAFNSKLNSLSVKTLAAELNEKNKKTLALTVDRAFTYLFSQERFREQQKPRITLQILALDLSLLKLLKISDEYLTINNGILDGNMDIAFGKNQKMLFDANIETSQLDITVGGRRYENLGFEQQLSGTISKEFFLSIAKFQTAVKNKQKPILVFKGIGNIDIEKKLADFSLGMSGFSTRLIPHLPLPPENLKGFELLNELEPFFLSLTCAGQLDLNAGTAAMKPIQFNIFQNSLKVAGITVKLQDGKIANIIDKTELNIDIEKLEISQFNVLLADKTFQNGNLNGKIIGGAGKGFKSLSLKSSLNITELELLRGKDTIKNLLLKLAFSTELKESGQLQMRDLACGLRQNKNLILGISGFGDLDPAAGNGKFQLVLDYLNYNFLNIISPGHFTNGRIKGKLLIDILDQFKNTHIQTDLELLKLGSNTLSDPLDGKAVADITLKPELFVCRNFLLKLYRGNSSMVDITGSTSVPAEKSGKPIVINLESKIIDIDKIKKLFGITDEVPEKAELGNKLADKSSGKREEKVENYPPLSFDLGPREYDVKINLQGIKYNSVLSAHVDGDINAHGKSISVRKLNIISNEDELNFKGDFMSTEKGIKYKAALKSDKFNLGPIFYTFLRNDFKSLKGTLKKLDVQLQGTGLVPVALWDNMTGFARSEFADMKIPNSMSKTLMGKLLLLPFDIMIEIQKLVPTKTLTAVGKVSQFIVDFQNDIKVISFQDGKMDIAAENGKLMIRDFRFSGELVRSLSFYGELGLGSTQVLDLNSSLDISGIVLPVKMYGTVRNPEINYRKTTVDFMAANTINVLDATGKILQEGRGDVRKVINDIFDNL